MGGLACHKTRFNPPFTFLKISGKWLQCHIIVRFRVCYILMLCFCCVVVLKYLIYFPQFYFVTRICFIFAQSNYEFRTAIYHCCLYSFNLIESLILIILEKFVVNHFEINNVNALTYRNLSYRPVPRETWNNVSLKGYYLCIERFLIYILLACSVLYYAFSYSGAVRKGYLNSYFFSSFRLYRYMYFN